MNKFTAYVIGVGLLALWPVVTLVRTFIESASGYAADASSVILVTLLIYVAAGVVIVAPAWVINQVIVFLVKHTIIQAFTPKARRDQ